MFCFKTRFGYGSALTDFVFVSRVTIMAFFQFRFVYYDGSLVDPNQFFYVLYFHMPVASYMVFLKICFKPSNAFNKKCLETNKYSTNLVFKIFKGFLCRLSCRCSILNMSCDSMILQYAKTFTCNLTFSNLKKAGTLSVKPLHSFTEYYFMCNVTRTYYENADFPDFAKLIEQDSFWQVDYFSGAHEHSHVFHGS